MHDPALVRGGKGVGDRHGDVKHTRERKAVRLDRRAQGAARDALHDDHALAVDLLDRVDGDDVRVVEGGDGARFPLEAGQAAGVARGLGGQDLQRDLAAEPRVPGETDLAHAA